MTKTMLIDATQVEETRVAVIQDNRLEEFDFETASKRPLKGNIYLAKVTRVEPSLQAAFLEYGGNRQCFLPFSEIHPDYYQIPIADRQALIEQELESERDSDDIAHAKSGAATKDQDDEDDDAEGDETVALSVDDEDAELKQQGSEDDTEDNSDEEDAEGDLEGPPVEGAEPKFEAVGGNEDDREEIPLPSRRSFHRRYKIQEVIKKNQIILIQVVKEERGNKGAAVTTYLSIPGRYCVLMPNTPRGGGISRKITNSKDRKRLKEVAECLEVPRGMGVILRTAGATRTKLEVRRDYEYLMRLWTNVRDLTLQSVAPALVYEEGSLIKRSIRDLYVKDIEEIFVEGDEGYKEAKNFMKMLMPSHAKNVKQYKETTPLFSSYGVEGQLDQIHDMQVTLKSGGYLVINQTEALVAIDVNSGKATREHNIEDTALKTNLEAAEEVARQLRLRDLAGLVVIDFIDMDHWRNNRSVEKRLRDVLKQDRARIQVGRISPFGLLEMSRQRMRTSVIENTMHVCEACYGSGRQLSPAYMALRILRNIEEMLLQNPGIQTINVQTYTKGALYLLNNKRANLSHLEEQYGVTINVEALDKLPEGQTYNIQKTFVPKHKRNKDEKLHQPTATQMESAAIDDEAETTEEHTETEQDNRERSGRSRRRRGGRGRGRNRDNAENMSQGHTHQQNEGQHSAEVSEKSQNESETGKDREKPQHTKDKDDVAESDTRRRRRRSGRTSAAGHTQTDETDTQNRETATQSNGAENRSAAPAEHATRQPSYRRYREARNKTDDTGQSDKTAALNAQRDAEQQVSNDKKTQSSTKATARQKPESQQEAKAATKPEPKTDQKTDQKTEKGEGKGGAKTSPDTKAESSAQEDNRPRKSGWWSKRFRNVEAG